LFPELYTEVERCQHLTQADQRVFRRDYVAQASSVDGRLAFWNEKVEHDHVDYSQSFAGLREAGLPTELSAEREAAAPGRDSRF